MVGTRDASEVEGPLVDGPVVDWTDGPVVYWTDVPVVDPPYPTGISQVHKAGAPDQVAEATLRYRGLGATTLLRKGFDPVVDAVAFGEGLLPRLRGCARERVPLRAGTSVGC